jgi:hypothetical protein
VRRLLIAFLAAMILSGVFSASQASAQTEPASEAAPVGEMTTSAETSEVTSVALDGRARRYHVAHTWRRTFLGVTVQRYTIDVRWTGNRRTVWNVDIGRDGSGSWGWHFCGSRPAGKLWFPHLGRPHFYMRAYGFGHFGHWPISPGCILGDQILGGSITVSATGGAYVRHGTCCDAAVQFTSTPPGLLEQEFVLAA